MEEVVMAVRTRGDIFPVTTRIDATADRAGFRARRRLPAIQVQPERGQWLGERLAHESGIHKRMACSSTAKPTEIMRAEDVGWTTNKLTLGKLSGRNALHHLQELGFSARIGRAAQRRLRPLRAGRQEAEIFDEDLQALMSDEVVTPEREFYKLVALRVYSETGEPAAAASRSPRAGWKSTADAEWLGPRGFRLKAIEAIAQSGASLLLYSVNAITGGTDAQGEVTVRLAKDGRRGERRGRIGTSSSPRQKPM